MEELDPTIKALASAIKHQETRGEKNSYTAKGASGEFGAYQFMPDTWKAWAGTHLGDPKAQPTVENQNKVAYNQIKSWKDKGYNPAQIAAAWNAGEGSLKGDKWKNNVGTNNLGVKYDTPSYVKNVSKFYQDFKPKVTPEIKTAQGFNLSEVTSNPQTLQDPGMLHNLGVGVVKSFVEPVQALAGGAYNAVAAGNRALGGSMQPITDINSLAQGGDKVAPFGRDTQGNELTPGQTALQGAGAVTEIALNYGTGGLFGSIAKPVGRAAIPIIKNAAKDALVGAGVMGGDALRTDPTDPMNAVEQAGIGAGANATLGLVGNLASKAISKATGAVPDIVDAIKTKLREGDSAGASAIKDSPEYKQVLKANNLTPENIDKSFKESIDELKNFEDQGIDRAAGKSQTNKERAQAKLKDDQRAAFLENSVPSNNPDNPFAETNANIRRNIEDIGANRQEVIDAVRGNKVQLSNINTDNIIKNVDRELYNNNVTGTDLTRAVQSLKDDLKDTIEQISQREGREFDIADMINLKTKVNKRWDGESFSAQLDTAIGNVLRKELKKAEAKAIGKSKEVIKFLNDSDKTYSRLKQAEEYSTYLQSLPGQKPSRLLNMFVGGVAGANTGGNPLAFYGAMMLSNRLQGMAKNSGSRKLLNTLAGKVRNYSTDELIGMSRNVLKTVGEKGAIVKAEKATAKSITDKQRFFENLSRINSKEKATAVKQQVQRLADEAKKEVSRKAEMEKAKASLREILRLPAPKEGAPMSSNNVPIQMGEPASEVSKGFDTPLKIKALLPLLAVAGVVTAEEASAASPTPRQLGSISSRLIRILTGENINTYPGGAAPKPEVTNLNETATVEDYDTQGNLVKKTVAGKQVFPPVEEVKNVPKKEVKEVVVDNSLKVKTDPTDNTEYKIKGRTKTYKESDLETLAAILHGEIAYDRPLDKTTLEARTIANVVLNRMESNYPEWKNKTAKDVLLQKNQFQAAGTTTYENWLKGKDIHPVKAKAIAKVIEEIRNGKLENNVPNEPFYAHLANGTIRVFANNEELEAAKQAGLIKGIKPKKR